MAREIMQRLAPHAQDLGCSAELELLSDLLETGNGALRQRIVYEANRDVHELMAEIVSATA